LELIALSLAVPKSIVQLAAVLAAAAVLLWATLAGVGTGKNRAAANTVAHNAEQVAAGLHNFFNDQERFPSAAEFQDDHNLMLAYFSSFPPIELAGGSCRADFLYLRPSPQTFKLQFCLAAAAGNYRAGWSQLTQDSQ
jgi:hypothetical protein